MKFDKDVSLREILDYCAEPRFSKVRVERLKECVEQYPFLLDYFVMCFSKDKTLTDINVDFNKVRTVSNINLDFGVITLVEWFKKDFGYIMNPKIKQMFRETRVYESLDELRMDDALLITGMFNNEFVYGSDRINLLVLKTAFPDVFSQDNEKN